MSQSISGSRGIFLKMFLGSCLLAAPARATVVTASGLPDMLTSANLSVPMDPGRQPIAPMYSLSHYDQSFMFTATGASGPGVLEISFSLWGTPYMGDSYGYHGETMAADASIGGSGGPGETRPWGQQGSTGNVARWEIPFTFGVPQAIHISSDAEVLYGYTPPWGSPPPPYLQGSSITAGARIGTVVAASMLDESASVLVNFSPFAADAPTPNEVYAPEPASGVLLLAGIGVIALLLRRRPRQSRGLQIQWMRPA